MHEAELVFSYPETIADAVHRALSPETDAQVPKTAARVERTAAGVAVHIRADDLSSLRAALNSYTRWADAAERAARIGAA